MYVAQLEIDGIRGFAGARTVNLDFARPDGSYAGWTVLAGRNGSGKSTILQSIALGLVGAHPIHDLPSWPGTRSIGSGFVRLSVALRKDPIRPRVSKAAFELHWDDFKRRPRFFSPTLDALPDDVISRGDNAWFCAGYGPVRRLSSLALKRGESRPTLYSSLRPLFDEDISLVEGVNWLVEQHLYRLEERSGARRLIDATLELMGDGLLPDDFQVSDVDSDGLWICRGNGRFPLQQMSDGYRTVTALVVDLIRQINLAFADMRITHTRDGMPVLAYPGVVLIDEVETHLHVSWQRKIGDWLKSHFPLVQFIVTSHSPYICQSADPNGLIRLPGPEEPQTPHPVDRDLYQRVVYGSGDDAILTELFGIDTPYSTRGEHLRRELVDLEEKVLIGEATAAELATYRRLSKELSSSFSARVDEVSARLAGDA